jgi:hypothetical protein
MLAVLVISGRIDGHVATSVITWAMSAGSDGNQPLIPRQACH